MQNKHDKMMTMMIKIMVI